MSELNKNLKPFHRRVRVVRAWFWAGIGATFGTVISVVLAVLDFARVHYTDWTWLIAGPVLGLVLGCVAALLKGQTNKDLADSIDRRASLQNRLGAASENHDHETLGTLVNEDALSHITDLRPAKVYPFKMSKWHAGPVAGMVVASALFMMGNTPLFLSSGKAGQRAELKQNGEDLERVAKPILENQLAGKEEKDLAKKLDRFAQELKRGRMEKPEALQNADTLMKQAEDLKRERINQLEAQRLKALQAMEAMAKKSAAKEMGLSDKEFSEMMKKSEAQDTSSAESGLSEQQKQELSELDQKLLGEQRDSQSQKDQEQQMQDRLDQIKKMLESGKNSKGQELTSEERKALEEAQKKIQEMMKDFKLSQKAQKFLSQLAKMKEYQELLEMAKKLQEANQQAEKGEIPKLTDEDIAAMKEKLKEMQKALEEMAEKYGSEEEMKKLIEEMKKALESAGQCKSGMGICFGCAGIGLFPRMGISNDSYFKDTKQLPLSDEEQTIEGKSFSTKVKGTWQEKGETRYTEVRLPTPLGDRAKTPYQKVLPKYKKAAEDALSKKQVPKEHEKRVREYFESLQGGK